MPLNIPNGSTKNISFGPARVFMGAWLDPSVDGNYVTGGATGTTPTFDVGFIGEDGVSVELTSESKNIVQGNPALIEYSFVQSQAVTLSFTSIEWNFRNFRLALGAGVTSDPSGGTGTTMQAFKFGGDPLNVLTSIHIQHEMAVTGGTLHIKGWKCQSAGGFNIPMGADEHQYEFSFNVLRSSLDWAKTTLAYNEQLISIEREGFVGDFPESTSEV